MKIYSKVDSQLEVKMDEELKKVVAKELNQEDEEKSIAELLSDEEGKNENTDSQGT